MKTKTRMDDLEALGVNPSNGAKKAIETGLPYTVEVEIVGVAPILFHAWNCEEVEAKAKAAKNSKAKKTDNPETMIYRDNKGIICIPGEYLLGSIINAAKFEQDPRSPRKSASDLYKAGILSLTRLASTGKKDWDYLDKRRAVVQRNAITRMRPALLEGWKAEFQLLCSVPEYIGHDRLSETITRAGKLIGIGDFRPSHGRFRLSRFEVLLEGK